MAGLPGLDIYGAHMRAAHYIAIAAATAFLGLKGFLLGAGIWVCYKMSQQQAGAAGRAPGGASTAQVQSFFADYFGQQGQAGGSGGGGRPGSSGTAQQQQQRQADPWAGRGKGHKLGGS